MPVITSAPGSTGRAQQALIIAACLALAMTVSAFGLLVFAVQQRALPLPAFSVRIGRVQFGGPCPSPTFGCDTIQNYYAIWRGDDQPDGSVHFQEIFFTYLPKKR